MEIHNLNKQFSASYHCKGCNNVEMNHYIENYVPLCSKCNSPMNLIRKEKSDAPENVISEIRCVKCGMAKNPSEILDSDTYGRFKGLCIRCFLEIISKDPNLKL